MRLLLTKHLNDADISKLGSDIVVDFVEVISIEKIAFKIQDLKNKSLIFTSINAVKSFFENDTSHQLTKLHPIYCVGEQSEKFLNQKGFEVLATKKNAEELSKYFIEQNKDEDYLHFCGDIALETLGKTFTKLGKNYTKVVSYATNLTYPKFNKEYDAVAFFSPSGVRSFTKFNSLEAKIIFSIGETTTNEILNSTKKSAITSAENTTEDLLNLIRQHASEKK